MREDTHFTTHEHTYQGIHFSGREPISREELCRQRSSVLARCIRSWPWSTAQPPFMPPAHQNCSVTRICDVTSSSKCSNGPPDVRNIDGHRIHAGNCCSAAFAELALPLPVSYLLCRISLRDIAAPNSTGGLGLCGSARSAIKIKRDVMRQTIAILPNGSMLRLQVNMGME